MKKLEKQNIRDIFALSPMQEGMLYHYLKSPASQHYFEQLCLELNGEIDKDIFEKAWNLVIEANEMLRTVFRWEKVDKPVQVVMKQHTFSPDYYDFSDTPGQDVESLLETVKDTDRKNKFDLRETPFRVTLCKLKGKWSGKLSGKPGGKQHGKPAGSQYQLIISNHHILYDGWSNGILLKEFLDAYNCLLKAGQWVKPFKTSFKEFIKWTQKQDVKRRESYWADYLNGVEGNTPLPVKGEQEKTCSDEDNGRYRRYPGQERMQRLEAFANKNKLTQSTVLYTAWGLLLQRYGACEDMVLGTTVSGRSANVTGIEEMLGLFINTLPFRVNQVPGENTLDMLQRLGRELLDREAFESTPLVEVKEYCGLGMDAQLFDNIMVIENYPLDHHLQNCDGPFRVTSHSMLESTHYPLTTTISFHGEMVIDCLYNPALLEKPIVEQLADHFLFLLEDMINSPHKEPHGLEILPEEEKKCVLVDCNETYTEYPRHKTIHRLFEEQVEKTPHATALQGILPAGPDEQALPCTLTYKELNRESNTLAQLLVRRGVNGIVGIKSERTIHQIIGIMGILKSGCAYLPIAPDTPHERIRFMVKDSQMKVLLTEQSIGSDTLGDTVDILDPGETIRSAANGEEKQAENERVITESSDLAYIVYTSGTTGKPKGTLTCHYNITRIVLETEYIKVYPSDRLLQVSNYAFDGSLFNIYGALLNGAALVLTTREEVLAVEALGGIIKSENITLFFVSTALFNALVDLAPGSLAGLRKILIGGERASVAHCRGAVEHMGANKLINGYGPTETTFFATSYEISEVPENTPSIPIGRPLSNTTVYILDKYLNPVPFMVQGEVYIGGEGGARGYLNNPQLTAEKFITVPPGIAPKVPPGSPYKTLYKSGDLARRLMDGNIEFIGRADSQVKIRGFRIELEEIENQLLERDEVMECVVRAKTRADGEHYLCAYILFNQPAINVDMTKERVPGNIRETLSQTLPHYMIPAFFIPITHLPLTPNGKVDTKALPEPPDGEVATGATYIPPGNKIEERVAEIWSEILHIKKTAVSVDAVFFQVGGHSLKTTLMASKIHKAFDIKIPLSEVFKAPTIRGIADYLKNADKKKYASIKPVEKKEYYPVSSPQKRLYILQQMEPGDTGYNMPGVIPSADGPDKRELETIFQKLIARHESLRTSFHITNDGPVQRIHDKCDITIEEHKTTEKEVDSLLNAFTRPFDLSRAPLLRVALVEIAPSLRRVFFVDMHHIISDGTSVEILREEFFALCEGKEPAPIRLQYKDFSEWQAGAKQVEWVKQQELYWLNQFPDELPELNLPADYSRTRVRNFDGAEVSFVLHHSESRALKQVAGEAGATMYMLVLTLYTILLSKLSGREDIIVGTPVAARQHDDLQNIIGMFVNTLAMRNSPKGGKTFKEFLGEVKGRVLDAFENQEYQFGDLVEKVAPQRDTSRNPIFDVMLNLLNQREDNREIPEPQENDLNEHKKGVAKFDLTLTTVEKGEELLFNIDYSTQLFKAPTIDRFISYLRKIVSGITANKNIRIADLEILSEEEKKRILVDFNDTASKYPGHKRIHTLFEEQAAGKPESIALVCGEETLTYGELNGKANRLARTLINRGAGPNRITGVMLHRSPEMVIAILAILKTGGAYLPIDPSYPEERKKYMPADSGAQLIITRKSSESGTGGMDDDKIIDMDAPLLDAEDSNPDLASPGDLVYVIFTSGSTGKPKGAGVFHRGFVNLVHWYISEFELNADDGSLLLTSPSFDFTQKNIFAPLVTGAALHLPVTNYFDPASILHTIHQRQLTWLSSTPGMFYKLTEEIKEFKKLSSLRYVLLGGEAISIPVFNQWLESEECNAQVVNIYGPTECTDICAFYPITDPGRHLNGTVPIGKPISNARLYVLDSHLHPLPIGVTGEICIGGDGVGAGYINHIDLTADKFVEVSFTPNHTETIYRTGDLGKWLEGGNIEFLGRIDHQVKIRGFRIEMGEIENQLLKRENIKETVVIARGEGNDKYLCAYVVPNDDAQAAESLTPSALSDYLSSNLPDYMVPAFFIQLKQMPLNTNGKVNRGALPAPSITLGDDYTAPRDNIEKKLVGIWSRVLGIEKKQISIDANFFKSGGHSLKATLLTSGIQKQFNVALPLAEIFKAPTVKGLAQYIKTASESRYTSIEPTEKKEYYPASSPQRRLYILQQMETDNTAYNMPAEIPLEEEMDKGELEAAFQKLIARHESLRTSFHIINDSPVQRIHDKWDFSIDDFKATEKEAGTLLNQFTRPFDLSKAPLLRVGLVEIEPSQRRVLFIDMHHIISDGTSQEVLQKEFTALRDGNPLPPIKLQYKDYSEWLHREERQEFVKRQESYWINRFSDELPVLDIPTDYPRPLIQSFEGAAVSFELSHSESSTLKQVAGEAGATMYMVVLALYSILLSKLSGQEDIIVGTPIAARRHDDLQNIIGMFVNTLPMRNTPKGDKTFEEFLEEVKIRVLDAFENQEYQFENLVEHRSLPRDIGRNPIFDVMLNLITQSDDTGEISAPPEEAAEPLSFKHKKSAAKFDLTLDVVDKGERLSFNLNYGTKLFKANTIDRFILYLTKIISGIVEKDTRIADLEIISAEEKEDLLTTFNNTYEEYPEAKTIHRLFEEQVAKTPDRVALTAVSPMAAHKQESPCSMTYRELEQKSTQTAQWLLRKGVKPGAVVGLLAERSCETMVGMLAILKTGGAYLPIEPDYPRERIQFMLQDSNAKLLLCKEHHYVSPNPFGADCRIMLLNSSDTVEGNSPGLPGKNRPAEKQEADVLQSVNPAYVIYTSGSTGKPKGVLVQHRSVVNLAYSQMTRFKIDTDDRVMQFASICFDASVEQIFITFFSGAALVLINKETILDENIFRVFTARQSVTHIHTVPSFLMDMKLNDFSSLRRVISGGDDCPPALAEKWMSRCDFYNEYGPTETTVTSLEVLVKEVDGKLPPPSIGKPIGNTSVYILDRHKRLVPRGVTGELYIGGDGVACGYLNRPELTAERFVNWSATTDDTPAALRESNADRRIYRTGDLARWLPDGNIRFLGRIDFQVKIRGFRIELGEIENQLLKLREIKETIVITKTNTSGEKYICAYVVPTHPHHYENTALLNEELRNKLSPTLPDYMLPSFFVTLEKIPLTPNGKVDRKALPEPGFDEAARGGTYVAPADAVEGKVTEIWSQILGIEESTISVNGNFFQMGGHSLKATVMISRIHKELESKVPLAEIFNTPSIRGIAQYIKNSKKKKYASIKPAEKKEYYPASSPQKRLYILQQMETGNTRYNMPASIPLEKEMEKQELEAVFQKLIARHESFRTSFHIINGLPVQKIHAHCNFKIDDYKTTEKEAGALLNQFTRPFDLSKAPLLRVGLVKIEPSLRSVFFIDMHHIIFDGTSQEVLQKEFAALYAGRELPPVRLQYKDFSQWQNELPHLPQGRKQEAYWLGRFKEIPPRLEFPTDFPKPEQPSDDGETVHFQIDGGLTARVKELTAGTGTTVYILLLAVYGILLSKYTTRKNIVVGSGIAGRTHADLESTIGMFINMLALRLKPEEDKTFDLFLQEVKETALGAFNNQDYQYETLIRKLNLQGQTGKQPLFEMVYTHQNIESAAGGVPDLKFKPYGHEQVKAKFDMTLHSRESGDFIAMVLIYKTALFKRSTVEDISKHFIEVLEQVLADGTIELQDIAVSYKVAAAKPSEEKHDISFDF